MRRLRPSYVSAASVSLLLGITLAARALAAAGPPPRIVVSAPKPPIAAPRPLIVAPRPVIARPPVPHPVVAAPIPRPMMRGTTTIQPPSVTHQAQLSSPPRDQALAVPNSAPSAGAARRDFLPFGLFVSSTHGRSQLPQTGAGTARAHSGPLAFANKTTPPWAVNRGKSKSGTAQISNRNQTNARQASAQAQAAKLPSPAPSAAVEVVSPPDLSSDGLQTEADVADGIGPDVAIAEQPEGAASDSSNASQSDAEAARAQPAADEASLAGLIVRRDQANAQFDQEVSVARARFANDQDLIAYRRALSSAQDALARRLAPILQQMAHLNHTGIDNGKLLVSDIARRADKAFAYVSTLPKPSQCGSASTRLDDHSFRTAADVPDSVCQHDSGSSSRAAPR